MENNQIVETKVHDVLKKYDGRIILNSVLIISKVLVNTAPCTDPIFEILLNKLLDLLSSEIMYIQNIKPNSMSILSGNLKISNGIVPIEKSSISAIAIIKEANKYIILSFLYCKYRYYFFNWMYLKRKYLF